MGLLAEFCQRQRSVVVFNLVLEFLGHPAEADDNSPLELSEGVVGWVGLIGSGHERSENEKSILTVPLPRNDESGVAEIPLDLYLLAFPLAEVELPGVCLGLCIKNPIPAMVSLWAGSFILPATALW